MNTTSEVRGTTVELIKEFSWAVGDKGAHGNVVG
jgi:hypothetical protein